jgi:hypothetical protein
VTFSEVPWPAISGVLIAAISAWAAVKVAELQHARRGMERQPQVHRRTVEELLMDASDDIAGVRHDLAQHRRLSTAERQIILTRLQRIEAKLNLRDST